MIAYFHNAYGTTQIVMFGDSLVAGYGLNSDDSLPSKLEKKLKSEGLDLKIENAGISGNTTGDALYRVNDILSPKPDWIIIVLGGNDMLRGFDPSSTYKNLEQIITQIQEKKVRVILTKIQATPAYGLPFKTKFDSIYTKLIDKYDVESIPFFMEYVVTNQTLMLQDGVHPNALGVDLIVEKISPQIIKILKKQ